MPLKDGQEGPWGAPGSPGCRCMAPPPGAVPEPGAQPASRDRGPNSSHKARGCEAAAQNFILPVRRVMPPSCRKHPPRAGAPAYLGDTATRMEVPGPRPWHLTVRDTGWKEVVGPPLGRAGVPQGQTPGPPPRKGSVCVPGSLGSPKRHQESPDTLPDRDLAPTFRPPALPSTPVLSRLASPGARMWATPPPLKCPAVVDDRL
ncbi:collagen alpha-1(I) chain-like [Felis catus]|uniref:collagen alpha-1(I) chain-like n=1 Tax=Felis catus TaxID=9685 RepID=UPI001D198AE4|nr:collagen alpha-1(I) chain-like [Felis catus]